jgi:signal transduction histidine kinase
VSARRLAWTIFGISMAFVLGRIVLDAFGTSRGSDVGEYIFVAAAVLLYATVGALITSRQMGNRVGLIFSWVALTGAVSVFAGRYASLALERDLPFVSTAAWIGDFGFTAMIGPIAFLFLIFPTGSPPSRRWGWLLRIMLVAYAITVVLYGLTPGPIEAGFSELDQRVDNPISLPVAWQEPIEALTVIGGLIVFGGAVLSLLSLIQRYRRAADIERQQIKLLAFLGTFTGVFVVVMFPLQATGVIPEEGALANISFFVLIALLFVGIPVMCAIAILKHGLWELDVVVKKTVQYGLLVAGFVLVVGVVSFAPLIIIGVGGRVDLATIAIGALLAIGFTVAPSRARRWANRIVYGKRSTPYEVMSEFAERVGETYSTEDVLPRMAQLLGEATGARTAKVWLRLGNEMRTEAAWPTDAPEAASASVRGDELPPFGDEEAFEVRHQGELLGALTVSMPANDPINPTKAKLARDMASQAGLVLRNVRLIEELRASRQRLVTAQDEERRKLERNIHDGAQQQLVALTVKLRLLEQLAEKDPPKARAMAAQIQEDTTTALDDLRDLARGIYPPLLADKGLPAALSAQARKSPVPVEVEAGEIGRYSQDVEAAVYFSCLEALQNVTKYADASKVSISLSRRDGRLSFSVVDDGVGFDTASTHHGTGLQGIADRIDALGGTLEIRSRVGGGTSVQGTVPAGSGGR